LLNEFTARRRAKRASERRWPNLVTNQTDRRTPKSEVIQMDLIVLAGGIIIFALVATAVYAVVLQRRAMAIQNNAVS
jgi:L-aminopeptidase/D-esterase-like protein